MANRVRRLREVRGLTQQELGDLIGMSHASVQRIENGKQGLTEETVSLLSKALRCHPGELFAPLPSTGIESPDEKAILDMARRLNGDAREHWLTIGQALGRKPRKINS